MDAAFDYIMAHSANPRRVLTVTYLMSVFDEVVHSSGYSTENNLRAALVCTTGQLSVGKHWRCLSVSLLLSLCLSIPVASLSQTLTSTHSRIGESTDSLVSPSPRP